MADAPDNTNKEIKEYFNNLVRVAPKSDKIIATIQKGNWYQTVTMVHTTRLSDGEKSLLLNKNYGDWVGLHSNVLLSIVTHRVKNLNNNPPRPPT